MENLMGPIIYGSIMLTLITVVSLWIVFIKAGKPGWACIIPIYNVIVLLEIVGKPWWWLLLMLIPVVNFVIVIIVSHNLSLSFGQSAGFTVGLVLLSIVFLPILAFGEMEYIGPGGRKPVFQP